MMQRSSHPEKFVFLRPCVYLTQVHSVVSNRVLKMEVSKEKNCFLSDKKLGSREDCENRLLEFLANKDQDFYERGIMKLPLKWQQIIEQNGAYLTQMGQSETC
ncbi:hypothetical protein TNCV_4709511 [Trichonephila clavipes]|nr:hypothetical protein TNCV_4709511 [Trichonephila clavipes]